MTVICAACLTELDRPDALAQAGPYGASWYCRDVRGCHERRTRTPTQEAHYRALQDERDPQEPEELST
jgi:hypothetical protein